MDTCNLHKLSLVSNEKYNELRVAKLCHKHFPAKLKSPPFSRYSVLLKNPLPINWIVSQEVKHVEFLLVFFEIQIFSGTLHGGENIGINQVNQSRLSKIYTIYTASSFSMLDQTWYLINFRSPDIILYLSEIDFIWKFSSERFPTLLTTGIQTLSTQ